MSLQNETPSPPPASSSFPSSLPTTGSNQVDVTKAQPETYHKDFCPLQVHLHPQGEAKNYLWHAEQWPPKDICQIGNVNVTLFWKKQSFQM